MNVSKIIISKYLIIFNLLLLVMFQSQEIRAQFANGADIGWLSEMEDNGYIFKNNSGITKDCLEILKEKGINALRFRVWVNPNNKYCSKQDVAYMTQRARNMGFDLMLDFHLSDTWADPGHQTKPSAWITHTFTQLKTDVYDHIYDVLDTLKSLGVTPKWVQVGNETNNGMLWEDGRASTHMSNFAELIKSGYDAVKAIDTTIQVIVHLSDGHDRDLYRWIFDGLKNNGAKWDIIGMSVYPHWANLPWAVDDSLALITMKDMISRYNTKVMVCEAGFSYDQPVEANHYLLDLIEKTKSVGGLGVFYWEPESYNWRGYNLGAWDPVTKQPTAALDAFLGIRAIESVNVTMIINTATCPDTLRPTDIVQIRGESTDSTTLTWNNSSPVIATNLGGDYWQATFQAKPGDEIRYKIWTGFSLSPETGTSFNTGWEGPINAGTPSDNNRLFIVGNKDTTLALQYYHGDASTVAQYWRPFEQKEDSIAVYFRVNMAGVTSTGRFDPSVNGPVGVRGGPVDTSNILSWDKSKLILSREELSSSSGLFWSGFVYYPLSIAGDIQYYGFFIENDTDNGWENNVSIRFFAVPSKDTTINWVSFDNQPIIVSVNEKNDLVSDFELFQNYPNPFNPSTQINYDLPGSTKVKLIVYNSLGQQIETLVSKVQAAGLHSLNFNASPSLPSGVYYIRLTTNYGAKSIKVLLLK
ncbi:glycosyl hydrolase 53 family protein [bacterium BMS3Abin03]|nr:glycosyl hydrolase 53 family protein [bacterium BMS3Abin03]